MVKMTTTGIDITVCFGKKGEFSSCKECSFKNLCRAWKWNVFNKKSKQWKWSVLIYILCVIGAILTIWTDDIILSYLNIGILGGMLTADLTGYKQVKKISGGI
jgi:hypothetical protein